MRLPILFLRSFAAHAGTSLACLWLVYLNIGQVHAQASRVDLTAQQIIERIQDRTGGHEAKTWKTPTVDTFKAGDPATRITGIATTFTASMDVLEQAVAKHLNLIISHEPVFYNHTDATAWLKNDPVYLSKLAYIAKHHLVIWRFHDHLHDSPNQPDLILKGMVDALGWQAFQTKSDPFVFAVPAISLGALAAQIKQRLSIHALRVVGDPDRAITRFVLDPGASGREEQIRALRNPDVQALVAGESAEWETVMYVQDTRGEQRKGLILMGHEASEELGMRACADWLKAVIPELPTQFVPTGEPFWEPD